MSNVEERPVEQDVCSAGAAVAAEPDLEPLHPRDVPLGGTRAMRVRRVLPNRDRRMVGAWCFADAYGPDDITGRDGMQVPPHPHIGLQTVTWLIEGEVLHRDGLGNRALVRPGDLSLMTAGPGIAHSEQSPPDHSPVLHGAQLWVALPEAARTTAPAYEFHTGLPRLDVPGADVTVLAGELGGVASPATVHSPLVGAALALPAGARPRLPLAPGFEHAVLVLSAAVTVEGREVPAGDMLYLGRGRTELALAADRPAHALLLGGEPFAEDLVMWWNFVGRTHDDIVEARTDWERERADAPANPRFAPVTGYDGPALPAPVLPNARLKPRPRYHRH
ncbi:pirin family protein [Actinomadura algeriensis]|uniref:Redox-sensitive bicupin YhaK (Pirin superfamily) n=1 Tax=Actinomadura algeriensis TaxID=1679523 RepID=A0ABR9K506_9ACTN|nr:pirin family protein [Actinomadura algeriensis]MBE1537480.1 redox-sensitive bicupin YhaK (pirin superfamily) [Actinomadura algeriensis]